MDQPLRRRTGGSPCLLYDVRLAVSVRELPGGIKETSPLSMLRLRKDCVVKQGHNHPSLKGPEYPISITPFQRFVVMMSSILLLCIGVVAAAAFSQYRAYRQNLAAAKATDLPFFSNP